jgi:hypothetical protein
MSLTPAQRALRGRMAAYTLHSGLSDAQEREHTAPARQAFLNRFERQVDPDGILPPAERARRAEQARKAHMTGLALRSAKARAKGVNQESAE